jgi:hypothetical protein
MQIKYTDASKETSLHASQAGPVANKEAVGSWSWGGAKELVESNALLVSDPPFEETDIAERRKYFNVKDHREAMKFSPDNVYNLEVISSLSLCLLDDCLGIYWLYDMGVDFRAIYGLQQV